MKKRNSERSVGVSCSTPKSAAGMAIKKLSCELELRYLGKRPRRIGHGHKHKVQKHIAEGTSLLECNFALIDYKNGNEVIKKSVMTRQQAGSKNKVLKGTGIAWALVDS